jgi:ABC-2 type transport system ATP-binding protein
MKQKTLIARALVADPQIVFLDEPTAGLDPEAAHELMTYIHDLSREQGRTFFITSHRLEEMESVCTKVGVLAGGRVAAQGAPAEVARALVPEVRVRVTVAPGAALDSPGIASLEGVRALTQVDGGAIVEVTSRQAIPRVVRQIAAMPGDLLGVAEEPPTLEEAYLRLVHQEQAVTLVGAR